MIVARVSWHLKMRRSSVTLHFLIIPPLILSHLAFNNIALYAITFSVSFLLLVETPFTLFSSAWSLFDQAWSPGRLVISPLPFDGPISSWWRVIPLHWWILGSPSVCWSTSVAAFTSWSDIFFTRFTKLSSLYTAFDVAALQGLE